MSIMSRRQAILGALRAGALPALWPAWLPRLAFAARQTAPRGDTLVVIFLRGGADALNIAVPHGEAAYYRHRPALAIARPDDSRAPTHQRTLDLDGFFGFHPALAPLMPAWRAGHLAVVHACGSPDESRSHFRAMELMERGVEDERGPASGWIGRHLATLNTGNPSPLRAIGLGETLPRSLYGGAPVSTFRSIVDFHFGGDPREAALFQAALAALYQSDQSQDEASGYLGRLGRDTLDVVATLETLDPSRHQSTGGVAYPDTPLGLALKQVAMLVRAEVGLEVAAIDHGGWDTHFLQGGSDGLMAGLLRDLGAALAAFHADLADWLDRLTIVVQSEFGRRAGENASLGLDHGHGGLMFVVGGHVVGQRVHGRWPGLEPEQLVGPGDLAVTTDYRDVLGEICRNRLSNPALAEIFPDYVVTPPGVALPARI